jgi:hypothetical protein
MARLPIVRNRAFVLESFHVTFDPRESAQS